MIKRVACELRLLLADANVQDSEPQSTVPFVPILLLDGRMRSMIGCVLDYCDIKVTLLVCLVVASFF